jgi:hypothetical protein
MFKGWMKRQRDVLLQAHAVTGGHLMMDVDSIPDHHLHPQDGQS